MSYKIITAKTIDELVSGVNQHLKQGYEPIGGFVATGLGVSQTLYAKDDVKRTKEDEILFNKLKNKRKELCDAIGAPAYVIATNRMLENLIELKPKTKEDLRNVYGFSEQKINLYGDELVKIINE